MIGVNLLRSDSPRRESMAKSVFKQLLLNSFSFDHDRVNHTALLMPSGRPFQAWSVLAGKAPGQSGRNSGEVLCGQKLRFVIPCCIQTWGGVMNAWLQDFRYAFRMLGNNVVLTLVIVTSLAVGIGANSAIFSVVDALLLRPLPYPQPDR